MGRGRLVIVDSSFDRAKARQSDDLINVVQREPGSVMVAIRGFLVAQPFPPADPNGKISPFGQALYEFCERHFLGGRLLRWRERKTHEDLGYGPWILFRDGGSVEVVDLKDQRGRRPPPDPLKLPDWSSSDVALPDGAPATYFEISWTKPASQYRQSR